MAGAKSTKQKTAGTAGNAKKRTTSKKDQAADSPPNDWAQTVLNQLVEAQKTWFENAAQQNALLVETVNKLSETRKSAPTEALSDWVKQGIENFIEAQKRWSEIAVRQSEQILETVRSNADFTDSDQKPNAAAANQTVETLVKMRSAWLDFVTSQNDRLVNTMKNTLKIDDSSPAASLADFARQAVNNYVEVQKRWLNLAVQFPFPDIKDESGESKK